MPEPELIKARTTSERRAYLQGYVDALIHAQKDGIAAAAKWAQEMDEFERAVDDTDQN